MPVLPIAPSMPPKHTKRQRELASAMLHPYVLHEVLVHLPPSNLAPLLRVNSDFYAAGSRVLYESISYFPDRRGPTALEGIQDEEEDIVEPLTGFVRSRPNLKKAVLCHVKKLHIGYHHHNASATAATSSASSPTPSPSLSASSSATGLISPCGLEGCLTPSLATSPSGYATPHPLLSPSSAPVPIPNDPIHMPGLQSLHISGERFCTHKQCPYLSTTTPSSITVVRIDLFSGSPRWKNPFQLPTPHTPSRAIYLCQSPFFLRKRSMQGLSPSTSRVPTSIFIFALRDHEVEWRDTARRMSDPDAHAALVHHLSTLAMAPSEKILVVGTELVACHLRPDPVLLSTRPEDICGAFFDAVADEVRGRWEEESMGGDVEEQLAKVSFMSLREYAAKEHREAEVSRKTIDQWSNCFEQVVASSGLVSS